MLGKKRIERERFRSNPDYSESRKNFRNNPGGDDNPLNLK